MFLTKPDTGWAWVVLMSSFGMFTINGFLVYGYGMVQVALLERFPDDIAKTALAGSLFTTFLSCAGLLDGVLIRCFSCRLVAVCGGILMTSGIFISAFMTTLNWIIFTYGVVAGFGAGIQYTAIYITLGYNFKRNVNLALGFALSGCGIGTFVFTPLFAYFMQVYSLDGLFILLAGLTLQSVMLSSLFFPSSLENEQKYNNSSNVLKHKATGSDNKSDGSFFLVIKNLMKTKPFILLLMSIFIANFGTYIVYIHFANYSTYQGSSEMQTAFLLSVIGLCSCVARVLAGLACNSRAIDEPTLLSGTLGISGVFTCLLPTYGHTFTGQLVFAITFGLYAGCLYAVMNGITLRYLSLRDLGTALGIELATIGCGILTGPPANGLIIETTGNYDIGFVVAGLCILGGAVLVLVTESCNTKKPVNDVINLSTSSHGDTSPTPEEFEDHLASDKILPDVESTMMLNEV